MTEFDNNINSLHAELKQLQTYQKNTQYVLASLYINLQLLRKFLCDERDLFRSLSPYYDEQSTKLYEMSKIPVDTMLTRQIKQLQNYVSADLVAQYGSDKENS